MSGFFLRKEKNYYFLKTSFYFPGRVYINPCKCQQHHLHFRKQGPEAWRGFQTRTQADKWQKSSIYLTPKPVFFPSHQPFSKEVQFCPPPGNLAISGDIFVTTRGGKRGLLLSSGELRPRMLLNVLPCTGHLPQQRIMHPAPNVSGAPGEKRAVHYRMLPALL